MHLLSLLLGTFVGLAASTMTSNVDGKRDGFNLPIYRRRIDKLDVQATERRALRDMAKMQARYGIKDSPLTKRSAASVAMSDGEADAFYFIPLSVGTPAQTFQCIIDTGSADLWISTSPCTGCETSTPLYAPSSSSTSVSTSSPFEIQYGVGSATGTLVSDLISLAGFSVANQTFAAVTESSGVVTGSVSGILGAGWQSLASSKAVPFLQALAQGGALDAEIFSFAFTTFQSDEAALNEVEPGGIMSIGSANASLYTGTLNWVPLSTTPSYWLIPLQDVTVQGTSALSATDTSAAIDTGTTLIGGPSTAIAAIYAQIPSSRAVTIQGQSGYYSFPCTSSISTSLTIGGTVYDISPESFNAGAADTSGSTCVGAFFELETNGESPDWIIGDTFIKGVFTAFQFAPTPSIGFATLSSTAVALGSQNGGSSTASGSKGNSGSTSPAPRIATLAKRNFVATICIAVLLSGLA